MTTQRKKERKKERKEGRKEDRKKDGKATEDNKCFLYYFQGQETQNKKSRKPSKKKSPQLAPVKTFKQVSEAK